MGRSVFLGYKYMEVLQLYQAPLITVQGDGDNRAAAILSKLMAAESGDRLVVFHDSQVELLDLPGFVDMRGI